MISVFNADMMQLLPAMPSNSIDSAVMDPPYNLDTIRKRFGSKTAAVCQEGTDGAYRRASSGFMGKEWDNDIMADPVAWGHVLRVLKPGGILVAFSHSRTYHRMATAIEDAGFEIRDLIMWLYGTGFPKAHPLGDGWKTALKPAHEPICIARKPCSEKSARANHQVHGVAGFNIEACRVGDGNRFPANVIIDGSQVILDGFPDTRGAGRIKGNEPSAITNGIYKPYADRIPSEALPGGSAARFFYSAKATKAERPWHCTPCNLGGPGGAPTACPSCGKNVQAHPTVKPQALMRYLCRLVTPTGGTILDAFAGSGSTLQAARSEGFRAIGIEQDEEYYLDILRRLDL